MIKRRTVVLVERAYLIQAGIEKLLDEVPGMVITQFSMDRKSGCQKKLTTKNPI